MKKTCVHKILSLIRKLMIDIVHEDKCNIDGNLNTLKIKLISLVKKCYNLRITAINFKSRCISLIPHFWFGCITTKRIKISYLILWTLCYSDVFSFITFKRISDDFCCQLSIQNVVSITTFILVFRKMSLLPTLSVLF